MAGITGRLAVSRWCQWADRQEAELTFPVWFGVVVLAGMICFLLKSRRNYGALPELPAGHGIDAPDLTVIVPARNEEARIGRCLASFPMRLTVVDDGSTDRTAEIARLFGARVIPAPPFEPPVLGKPNACAAGARDSASKWLLFVDADTWYAQEFAAEIVQYAESESLDVVTAFLHQHCKSWWERVILPYAFALYFCGVSAARVNSPRSREALANGQCILVRREAYERMGGHGAVRASVIEDVALARIAKQHGLRLRVVRAEHSGFVRMYSGLSEIWRGFEKNSFRFLEVNPWTAVQVIAASIAMTSWLPAVAALTAIESWALAGVVAVTPFVLLRPWYGSRSVLFAPAGVYLFQLIALAGMIKTLTGQKSVWKGRRV